MPAAPRREAALLAAYANARRLADARARLLHRDVVDQHAAGADQRLGVGAALGEGVAHEALVEAHRLRVRPFLRHAAQRTRSARARRGAGTVLRN